ncbi:MAG: hypothetical protein J6S14_15885 [Clostridia bacterium]|nr:hypothetical protein [Clostridia bacterium]
MTCKKCEWGGGMSVRPDGVHELTACCYQLKQKLRNVTVEILECPVCGDVSIGWYRQDNTEEVDDGDTAE